MKFLAALETVGLMFLALGPHVVGAKTVVHRNVTIAGYHPDAIQTVVDTASGLLAVQVVGAATSLDQLKYLCQLLPTLSSRLHSELYNVTLIQEIVCAAAGRKAIPSTREIKSLAVALSSKIWTIQAIGAVEGRAGVQKLYHLINPRAASAVGLAAGVVKKDVRTAAATANKVAHFAQPAHANLTKLPPSDFTPAFEFELPFVSHSRVI